MIAELDEPELIPATKSPHGFLASPLSENISVKEDGSLVIVGCPIARTGWQKYVVGDLPQEKARSLGIDVSNPSATIDLYRPASEVFCPEFLASLNGAAITDGHPKGGEFVDKHNFKELACGHIQNPRKGPEPLEDGEWPIIADLVISAEPLIGKVLNKQSREISLGYDFGIEREGGKIVQCSMSGNHNAIVPKGRAGDLISIADALPDSSVTLTPVVMEPARADEAAAEAESSPIESPVAIVDLPATAEPILASVEPEPTYPPIVIKNPTKKENHKVAEKKNGFFRSLMGKHLIEKARAADADPEEIMDLAESLKEEDEPAGDKRVRDDADPPKNTQENEFSSETGDKKRMHDALDRAMAKDKSKGKDSDVQALKTLLDEFLTEEEKEPEHAADRRSRDLEPSDMMDADPSELESVLAGGAEDCPDCGMAHDASEECPGQEMVESGEEELAADEEGESPDPDSDDDQEDVEDRRKVGDRARAADAATAVLKMLRPSIARSNDKALHAAFNTALATTKASRASSGGYGKFAGAARARDKAPRNPAPERVRAADSGKEDPITKLQQSYDSAFKGGKK